MKPRHADPRVRPRPAIEDSPPPPAALARFLRGLSIGVLVGAAIAGSAVWDRWRARRDDAQP